jgi:predicted metalloprotease
MQWSSGRRSENIEDRRGTSVPLVAGGGLGTIVLLLLALFFGFDPGAFLQSGDRPDAVPDSSTEAPYASPSRDPQREFVSVVLADTEDTWRDVFRDMGHTYTEPKLVLFTDVAQSACGMAQSAVGPFYCPPDRKVYLDLSFFRALRDRFGAPGDFAQAYVIAHEVGHHVQLLLGIADRVRRSGERMPSAQRNALSVKQELQADCFAGVWGYHARQRNILDPGDLEEALRAAAAIGDDRLQQQSRGYVVPDSFTHGSSAQRTRWFKRGFDSGDPQQCDTFATARL